MHWAFAAVGIVAYVVATLLHLFSLRSEERGRMHGVAVGVAMLGAALHTTLLVVTLVLEGSAGLLGVQGGVLAGGLVLVALYLGLGWRRDFWSVGSLVMPLAALSVMASRFGHEPTETATGGLLPVHIILAMLGTVAFALALIFAVLYLVAERQLKKKRFGPMLRQLPSLDRLDAMGVRVIVAGFIVYTLSILLGMLWAWQTQGLRLDTRSLLAVLTWGIYGIMLQARLTAGWRGRKAARLTIVGALCAVGVLLTYFLRG